MKKIGELSVAHQIMANRRMVSYGMVIVKKPYPKRIDLRNKIESILLDAKALDLDPAREVVLFIQNNYRRRRKSA